MIKLAGSKLDFVDKGARRIMQLSRGVISFPRFSPPICDIPKVKRLLEGVKVGSG